MVVEKEIIINSDIDNAWKVLGEEFANAYKWASSINHSEGDSESFEGANCSIRGCKTSMGSFKEKLIQYSKENYLLEYEAVEGMPSFVKKATNHWQLFNLGVNKTKLKIKANIELNSMLLSFFYPIAKIPLSILSNQNLNDFKIYVETGAPSQRKLKAQKK